MLIGLQHSSIKLLAYFLARAETNILIIFTCFELRHRHKKSVLAIADTNIADAQHVIELNKCICHGKESILDGYLFCAQCGKHLIVHSRSLCSCWPLGPQRWMRSISNLSISNCLVAEIHALAIECEKNEDAAYALIKSYLENVDHSDNADLTAQIVCIQSRIEKLNNKITQIELFNKDHTFSSTESERIFAALKSSLSIEVDKIKNLKASYVVIPSDEDIWRFIKAARRFGYLKKIDREALEELVDKVYISKKENSSRLQQQRITIKFKYIGVISTCSLTRNGVLIRPDIGTTK